MVLEIDPYDIVFRWSMRIPGGNVPGDESVYSSTDLLQPHRDQFLARDRAPEREIGTHINKPRSQRFSRIMDAGAAFRFLDRRLLCWRSFFGWLVVDVIERGVTLSCDGNSWKLLAVLDRTRAGYRLRQLQIKHMHKIY